MPQLKINQQNFPIQQIREIKADQDLNKLRSELAGNGLDEVWFEAKGKHFLAIGESLNLSNLKSQSSLHVELNGEWIDAKVLGSQDDISSWSEGWAKGSSLGKSISLAWQGAQSKIDWQAIHGWSVGISVWPKQEPKTPAPVQTVPITVQTTVPTPQDTTSVSPPVIPEPDLDPALQKPKIEVFFTTPGQTPEKDPAKALAEFIGSAKHTVDIAAFELDNSTIRDAILKAHQDGRKVRVVTDSDYKDEHDIQALKEAGIEVIDDNRSGLMHNKFVVIDHGTPDAAVWTGSMNMTDNCVYKNNNNAILIRSPELADNFHLEFEEMFVDRQFGRTSPNVVPHSQVTVGKSLIETHFAAEGRVAGRVVQALNQAQESIHFMAFSFTHDAIGQVLTQRMGKDVKVRGVFEKTGANTQYSEYGKLKNLGADVRTDGNSKVMHHKVFVIDGKTVITGSFNFSESADEKNDENLLIIEDPELAKKYLEEFERVYTTSVQSQVSPIEPVDLH